MKQTPRRAESEIAALFSSHFTKLGMDPVQRIPILGRTGPDISINQMGMVVDVKSRKAVPASALLKPGELVAFSGSLLAVRLDELPSLWEKQPAAELRPLSKTVQRWFEHMDQWTKTNCPDGVSALALRRPGMPYGHSTVVIHLNDWGKIHDRSTDRHCWLPTQHQPAALFQAG